MKRLFATLLALAIAACGFSQTKEIKKSISVGPGQNGLFTASFSKMYSTEDVCKVLDEMNCLCIEVSTEQKSAFGTIVNAVKEVAFLHEQFDPKFRDILCRFNRITCVNGTSDGLFTYTETLDGTYVAPSCKLVYEFCNLYGYTILKKETGMGTKEVHNSKVQYGTTTLTCIWKDILARRGFELLPTKSVYSDLKVTGAVKFPSPDARAFNCLDGVKWSGSVSDGKIDGTGEGITSVGTSVHYFRGSFSKGIPTGDVLFQTVEANSMLTGKADTIFSVRSKIFPYREGLARIQSEGYVVTKGMTCGINYSQFIDSEAVFPFVIDGKAVGDFENGRALCQEMDGDGIYVDKKGTKLGYTEETLQKLYSQMESITRYYPTLMKCFESPATKPSAVLGSLPQPLTLDGLRKAQRAVPDFSNEKSEYYDAVQERPDYKTFEWARKLIIIFQESEEYYDPSGDILNYVRQRATAHSELKDFDDLNFTGYKRWFVRPMIDELLADNSFTPPNKTETLEQARKRLWDIDDDYHKKLAAMSDIIEMKKGRHNARQLANVKIDWEHSRSPQGNKSGAIVFENKTEAIYDYRTHLFSDEIVGYNWFGYDTNGSADTFDEMVKQIIDAYIKYYGG